MPLWYYALLTVCIAGLLIAAVSWGNARYQEARRRDRLAYRARYGSRERAR